MSIKRLYFFGGGSSEGDKSQKSLLGGKGANLAEMARVGLPVPPGFTICTKTCLEYQAAGGLPDGLLAEMHDYMGRLEAATDKRFGDPSKPLLVSVRSGAAISMPGMMDTVLNLGMNAAVCEGLSALLGDRFARDSYRRFIQMFGNVVDNVSGEKFEHELDAVKKSRNVENDTQLDAAALDEVIERYRAVYLREAGSSFPEDPWQQLERSVAAVFSSWDNTRAKTYRRLNRIPDDLGTAVNVQAMVFGNLGEDCGTGVGFTRNASTGEKEFYGEYLSNAQGEDVVAGIRTPLPVMASRAAILGQTGQSLEEVDAPVFKALMEVADKLESHYSDVQDLEFTFEHGKLYLLQTRTAKRSGAAWLRTQVDFVAEGLIDTTEAVRRVPADSLAQVLAPTLDPNAAAVARGEGRCLAVGLNAGPGAASGRIAFTADDAHDRAAKGEAVILVRDETTPEDIHGMHAAQGILTARGGLTSHAAVVARGMGKPCVSGCAALFINAGKQVLRVGDKEYGPGDSLTIDGSTGEVFLGEISIGDSEVLRVLVAKTAKVEDAPTAAAFVKLLSWADELRTLNVRTNADAPHDAAVSVALGAEGIGLCRTEHMFFEAERILAVRRMILSDNAEQRAEALAVIEPMQAGDFRGLFREMAGKPVTIRFLDPPLHEFLPHEAAEIARVASELGVSAEVVSERLHGLRESNPMLGHRGCRLGIHYPEITRMQARAIITAAMDVADEGIEVLPEIMIPFVGNVIELELQKKEVMEESERIFAARGKKIPFMVGTMIEIPRAALTSGEIAGPAEFFSFGTNDLTQMTLGVSRDDSGSFLPDYVQRGIYEADPFASVDKTGVGRLMQICVDEGRAARPGIKIGICGEHGGDPPTVAFCHEIGLNYVSCSPYRVPIARLAAAQAAIAD